MKKLFESPAVMVEMGFLAAIAAFFPVTALFLLGHPLSSPAAHAGGVGTWGPIEDILLFLLVVIISAFAGLMFLIWSAFESRKSKHNAGFLFVCALIAGSPFWIPCCIGLINSIFRSFR